MEHADDERGSEALKEMESRGYFLNATFVNRGISRRGYNVSYSAVWVAAREAAGV